MKYATKFVTVLTLTCFIITSLLSEPARAALMPNPSVSDAGNGLIPSSYGRITGEKYYGSSQVVINIQNLHCHAEVQMNINKILETLDLKYHLKNVYVEGGYGDVDTSWLCNISDRTLKKNILDTMVEKGELTGAEYYSATANRPDLLKGIEDEQLHKSNIIRLGALLKRREDFESNLKVLSNDLDYMKARYFTSKNKRFESIIEKYQNGTLDAVQYYTLLGKYVDSIQKDPASFNSLSALSMKDYPNIVAYLDVLRQSHKLNYKRVARDLRKLVGELKSRVSYAEYTQIREKTNNFSDMEAMCQLLSTVSKARSIALTPTLDEFFAYTNKSHSINPLQLITEERRLVADIRVSLSDNIGELEVSFLASFFGYYRDYLLTRLSADDFAYFDQKFDTFQSLWCKYTFQNHIQDVAAIFPILNDYYKVNLERNITFMMHVLPEVLSLNKECVTKRQIQSSPVIDERAQVLAALNNGTQPIVIVTGGFHTEGLKKLLEEKKISYVTIMPMVTKNTKFADAVYEKFAREQAKILSNALELGLAVQMTRPVLFFRMVMSGVSRFKGNEFNKKNIDLLVAQINAATKVGATVVYDSHGKYATITASGKSVIVKKTDNTISLAVTRTIFAFIRATVRAAWANEVSSAKGTADFGKAVLGQLPDFYTVFVNIMTFVAENKPELLGAEDQLIPYIVENELFRDKLEIGDVPLPVLARMPDDVQQMVAAHEIFAMTGKEFDSELLGQIRFPGEIKGTVGTFLQQNAQYIFKFNTQIAWLQGIVSNHSRAAQERRIAIQWLRKVLETSARLDKKGDSVYIAEGTIHTILTLPRHVLAVKAMRAAGFSKKDIQKFIAKHEAEMFVKHPNEFAQAHMVTEVPILRKPMTVAELIFWAQERNNTINQTIALTLNDDLLTNLYDQKKLIRNIGINPLQAGNVIIEHERSRGELLLNDIEDFIDAYNKLVRAYNKEANQYNERIRRAVDLVHAQTKWLSSLTLLLSVPVIFTGISILDFLFGQAVHFNVTPFLLMSFGLAIVGVAGQIILWYKTLFWYNRFFHIKWNMNKEHQNTQLVIGGDTQPDILQIGSIVNTPTDAYEVQKTPIESPNHVSIVTRLLKSENRYYFSYVLKYSETNIEDTLQAVYLGENEEYAVGAFDIIVAAFVSNTTFLEAALDMVKRLFSGKEYDSQRRKFAETISALLHVGASEEKWPRISKGSGFHPLTPVAGANGWTVSTPVLSLPGKSHPDLNPEQLEGLTAAKATKAIETYTFSSQATDEITLVARLHEYESKFYFSYSFKLSETKPVSTVQIVYVGENETVARSTFSTLVKAFKTHPGMLEAALGTANELFGISRRNNQKNLETAINAIVKAGEMGGEFWPVVESFFPLRTSAIDEPVNDAVGYIHGEMVTDKELADWKEIIQEGNGDVKEQYQSLIDAVVKPAGRQLYADKFKLRSSVKAYLKEHGINTSDYEIDKALESLDDMENSFQWFISFIKEPRIYLLGSQDALAVDVIIRLYMLDQIDLANTGVSGNRLSEYLLHEVLHRIKTKGKKELTHKDIIAITNTYLGRPAYDEPRQTLVGKSLRGYIDEKLSSEIFKRMLAVEAEQAKVSVFHGDEEVSLKTMFISFVDAMNNSLDGEGFTDRKIRNFLRRIEHESDITVNAYTYDPVKNEARVRFGTTGTEFVLQKNGKINGVLLAVAYIEAVKALNSGKVPGNAVSSDFLILPMLVPLVKSLMELRDAHSPLTTETLAKWVAAGVVPSEIDDKLLIKLITANKPVTDKAIQRMVVKWENDSFVNHTYDEFIPAHTLNQLPPMQDFVADEPLDKGWGTPPGVYAEISENNGRYIERLKDTFLWWSTHRIAAIDQESSETLNSDLLKILVREKEFLKKAIDDVTSVTSLPELQEVITAKRNTYNYVELDPTKEPGIVQAHNDIVLASNHRTIPVIKRIKAVGKTVNALSVSAHITALPLVTLGIFLAGSFSPFQEFIFYIAVAVTIFGGGTLLALIKPQYSPIRIIERNSSRIELLVNRILHEWWNLRDLKNGNGNAQLTMGSIAENPETPIGEVVIPQDHTAILTKNYTVNYITIVSQLLQSGNRYYFCYWLKYDETDRDEYDYAVYLGENKEFATDAFHEISDTFKSDTGFDEAVAIVRETFGAAYKQRYGEMIAAILHIKHKKLKKKYDLQDNEFSRQHPRFVRFSRWIDNHPGSSTLIAGAVLILMLALAALLVFVPLLGAHFHHSHQSVALLLSYPIGQLLHLLFHRFFKEPDPAQATINKQMAHIKVQMGSQLLALINIVDEQISEVTRLEAKLHKQINTASQDSAIGTEEEGLSIDSPTRRKKAHYRHLLLDQRDARSQKAHLTRVKENGIRIINDISVNAIRAWLKSTYWTGQAPAKMQRVLQLLARYEKFQQVMEARNTHSIKTIEESQPLNSITKTQEINHQQSAVLGVVKNIGEILSVYTSSSRAHAWVVKKPEDETIGTMFSRIMFGTNVTVLDHKTLHVSVGKVDGMRVYYVDLKGISSEQDETIALEQAAAEIAAQMYGTDAMSRNPRKKFFKLIEPERRLTAVIGGEGIHIDRMKKAFAAQGINNKPMAAVSELVTTAPDINTAIEQMIEMHTAETVASGRYETFLLEAKTGSRGLTNDMESFNAIVKHQPDVNPQAIVDWNEIIGAGIKQRQIDRLARQARKDGFEFRVRYSVKPHDSVSDIIDIYGKDGDRFVSMNLDMSLLESGRVTTMLNELDQRGINVAVVSFPKNYNGRQDLTRNYVEQYSYTLGDGPVPNYTNYELDITIPLGITDDTLRADLEQLHMVQRKIWKISELREMAKKKMSVIDKRNLVGSFLSALMGRVQREITSADQARQLASGWPEAGLPTLSPDEGVQAIQLKALYEGQLNGLQLGGIQPSSKLYATAANVNEDLQTAFLQGVAARMLILDHLRSTNLKMLKIYRKGKLPLRDEQMLGDALLKRALLDDTPRDNDISNAEAVLSKPELGILAKDTTDMIKAKLNKNMNGPTAIPGVLTRLIQLIDMTDTGVIENVDNDNPGQLNIRAMDQIMSAA